jgi:phage tail tape-measure protein
MAAKQFPLSVVIRAIDRVTAPMRAIQGSIGRFDDRLRARFRNISDRLGVGPMTQGVRRLGSALGDLGRRAAVVGGALAGVGAAAVGLGALAARSLIATASEFERFQTILSTIEGSSEKANKAMTWVSNFAAKTPYELAEVTDNFVKLRAYGIDPTNGTLKTLGDTAAAMGKPLSMAVEALADAMTGENERLKEFGITASTVGKKITYSWQENGKTLTKTVDKTNRDLIRSTLEGIWSSRYGGAMEKLSGTWGGMMSNLKDQWARFKLLIMQSGVFEALRKRLEGFLKKLEKMAETGELKKLATVIGTMLTDAITAVWNAGVYLVTNWEGIKKRTLELLGPVIWLCKTFGTANVAIGALAGIAALALVPSIYLTAVAFRHLGIAIMTTPLGWILGAAALIAVAAYKIYKNWGPITDFFKTWWQAVKDVFSAVGDFFSGIWNDVRDGFKDGFINGIINLWKTLNPINLIVRAFTELLPKVMAAVAPLTQKMQTFFRGLVPDWAKGALSGGKSDVLLMGAASVGQRGAAAQQSHTRLTVDLNNLPPGSRVRADHTGRPDFELNQGRAFGPFGV